ncbi:MAG: class I SAM-dependent methyltransferase [Planctomycetota bacterium]
MRECVHEEYRSRARDHWWFRARRSIFDTFLDPIAPVGAGARILDIGPGSGVNLPVLAPRGRVTVVDFDRDSLAACAAQGADPVRCDATALPWTDASFDLVCALDVLEHLDEDRPALAEMNRLVTPRGRLLLTVPALRVLWGRQDVLAEHRRRYRRRELRDLLHESGFVIERMTYFNTLLFPAILLARIAMRPWLGRTVAAGRSDLSVRAPFGADALLERVFAAERHWLARHDLPIGVSLLALARRKDPSA